MSFPIQSREPRIDDEIVRDFVEAARKLAHGERPKRRFMPQEIGEIAQRPDLFLAMRVRYQHINDPDVQAAVRKLLWGAAQWLRDSERDAREGAQTWDRVALGSGLTARGTAGGALLGAGTASSAGTILVGAAVALAVGSGMRYVFTRRANRRASTAE